MTTDETLSIVIPAHNESESLPSLVREISDVSASLEIEIREVIIVDDGSTDDTPQVGRRIVEAFPDMKLQYIRLRRRFGKSAALAIGFQRALGTYVVTMDGDLQDDPKELPRFVTEVKKGFDVVSGWKQTRRDPLSKRIPSRIFNAILRALYKIDIHDFNCGYKIYRRSVLQGIKVYGDLHRFIPLFLAEEGYAIGEIVVGHRERTSGVSKYGPKRLFTGLLDLLSVLAVTKFIHKPGQLFGGIGLLLGVLGIVVLGYLGTLWFMGARPIGTRPMFFIGILAVLLSGQFIFFGMLAEMIVRLVVKRTPASTIGEEFHSGDTLI